MVQRAKESFWNPKLIRLKPIWPTLPSPPTTSRCPEDQRQMSMIAFLKRKVYLVTKRFSRFLNNLQQQVFAEGHQPKTHQIRMRKEIKAEVVRRLQVYFQSKMTT